MPRVLVLSYDWPPVGGAGVQRGQRLARHLVSRGVELVVVTGTGQRTGRWSPRDETLAQQMPRTSVHRIRRPEPTTSRREEITERWVLRRCPWTRWWIEGCVETGQHVGRECDVIYAHMQPYASAEAASRLSSILGIPWVADLGDPWALDEMLFYPSAFHRRRDEARMRRLLGTAAATIMSVPEAVERLRRAFPELAQRRVVAIPNGFEASALDRPRPLREDGKFRVVHTGFLHTELGVRYRKLRRLRRLLGGAPVPGVDVLTRSHVYLIDAVNRLLASDPSLRDQIEIHLAGVMSQADLDVASRCPVVRVHGYLPHGQTVELLLAADLLFLPMQDMPPGIRAGLTPGKTYEYLATGLPILAAVPPGDARDLLSAAGTGFVVSPKDVDAMVRVIRKLMATPRDQLPTLRRDVLEPYDYHNLASELAALFQSVIDDADRTPGLASGVKSVGAHGPATSR